MKVSTSKLTFTSYLSDWTLALADAAVKSVQDGRTVKLSEVLA
jgi:hypothetical protein